MNSSSKSANSDSKPKRSFNSMSNANPSSSSVSSRIQGSGKKRKGNDPNQKTLGMAWGANSRSSARTTFRNSNFPDFGSYMEMKNQKLHQQFDAEASNSSHSGNISGKPIFQGVSIFVDGYTVPSHQELKSYMLQHGGRFQNYFSRQTVTHIICSNLPDSKIKNLRSFSRGLPIVKPTWVVESVAANKLLSWFPYQLDQIASETDKQPKVLAFFGAESCRALHNTAEDNSESRLSEPGRSSIDAKESEIKEIAKEFQSVSDGPMLATGSTDQRLVNVMDNQHEIELDAQVAMGNSMIVESSNSKRVGPTSMGHSTLTDPNFAENYFKFSRLHFIGTWRNRYRKRYPSSSEGFKNTSYSHNSSVSTQNKTIIHVDMDCFFVAVVIRNRPDLKDKPVAICHSDNPRGTAEISSASYPARDHGVKAGMFVRDAKALCPQLVTFPYNFDAYEEVADQFYDILHEHCNKVQAVSCDEAFVDVSDSGVDPQSLAAAIRKEILDTTGCTASAGIAGNMLMARVATRAAKPDGCCYIPPEQVENYLHELPVKSLPGIGHVLEEKLKGRQIRTCGQLRMVSKESLHKDFGVKTGDMLWNFSRGIDNRLVGVDQEIKSVGAEVNWGVRFNNLNDTKEFLLKLCKEVSLRLQGCGVQGRNITLKIKKRKGDAGEPVKYMGHGHCENLSRSITLPMATDDVEVLQRIATQLLGYFHIDAKDIRGVGLQASKLEAADSNIKRGHEKYSIRSWLVSSSARDAVKETDKGIPGVEGPLRFDTTSPAQTETTGGTSSVRNASLPSLEELDIGVIESLPPEVFSEINDLYSGELKNFLKRKQKNVGTSMPLMVPQNIAGLRDEERSTFDPLDKILPNVADEACNNTMVENSSKSLVQEGEQEKECVNENICMGPISSGGASRSESAVLPVTDNLMPSSFSQIDPSVLQQLPEELRVDILKSLPAHRSSHVPNNDVPVEHAQISLTEFMLKDEPWNGNPPKWVEYFSGSSCRLLNKFAELHNSSCTGSQLSSIFQRIMSISPLPVDDIEDDAFSCLCDLIKQYVRAIIEIDIEEIYACACLLKRLSSRSTLFLRIYNSILPHIQAAVSENYGGDLNICITD